MRHNVHYDIVAKKNKWNKCYQELLEIHGYLKLVRSWLRFIGTGVKSNCLNPGQKSIVYQISWRPVQLLALIEYNNNLSH